MTDISCWPKLIKQERLPWHERKYHQCYEHTSIGILPKTYIMIPTNEYLLGNLIGLLKRSKKHNNGDWFYEFLDIVIETMKKLGIEKITSNFGDEFTLEELISGDWLISK